MIAIIAILTAILLPVFSQARAKARQVSCISNLKQITLGIMLYQEDYDGFYPAFWFCPPNWLYHRGELFPWLVQPYVRNWQLFVCPNDGNRFNNVWYRGRGDMDCNRNRPDTDYPPDGLSYGMNEVLHWGGIIGPADNWDGILVQSGPYVGGYGAHSLIRPANTLLLADAHNTLIPDWHDWPCRILRAHDNNRDAHLKGVNLSYADGHVKWKRNNQVWADYLNVELVIEPSATGPRYYPGGNWPDANRSCLEWLIANNW